MSKLSAFLHPVQVVEEKEVFVSERFVKRDEDGNPVLDKNGNTIPELFRIRALTQEENDLNVKKSTRRNKDGTEYFDTIDYSRRTVVSSTVYPDFSDRELCEGFGVLDPLLVPAKMLRAGEYNRLLTAINDLNGFSDLNEDAKN